MIVKQVTTAALLSVSLHCSALDTERWVEAIRLTEGAHAAYPYGIRNGRAHSPSEARLLCKQTVEANHSRWLSQGSRGSFLAFLASRYCPAKADPRGHRAWLRNMSYFLKHIFQQRQNPVARVQVAMTRGAGMDNSPNSISHTNSAHRFFDLPVVRLASSPSSRGGLVSSFPYHTTKH